MPKTIPNEKIERIGAVNKGDIEFFQVTIALLPKQRAALRANKSKYLWKLFERHSRKVNNLYTTAVLERKIDKLLDKTPDDKDIPLSLTVWHVVRPSIYPTSTHIVSTI